MFKFLLSRTFTRNNSTSSNTITLLDNVVKAKSVKSTNNFLNDSSFSSFLGKSTADITKEAKTKLPDAFTFATQLPVSGKIAGRSLLVSKGSINRSISSFEGLVRANRLKEVYFNQRFYTKPNKRKLAKRIANRKKTFDNGIAKLFSVVRDAVRKGY